MAPAEPGNVQVTEPQVETQEAPQREQPAEEKKSNFAVMSFVPKENEQPQQTSPALFEILSDGHENSTKARAWIKKNLDLIKTDEDGQATLYIVQFRDVVKIGSVEVKSVIDG